MVASLPYHRRLIQRTVSLFETLHGFGTVDSLYGVTLFFRSNSYSAECPNVLTRVNEPMEPVPPEIVSGGCQVGLVVPVVAFVGGKCSKLCVAGAVATWTFKRLQVVRSQAAGTTQHGDNDDLSEEILQPWQGVSSATLLKIVSCLCLLSVVKSENIQRATTSKAVNVGCTSRTSVDGSIFLRLKRTRVEERREEGSEVL